LRSDYPFYKTLKAKSHLINLAAKEKRMKPKVFLMYLSFVMLFIVAAIAQESIPGGSTKASVKDKKVVAAAAFAIEAQEKAMQEPTNKNSIKLKLVEILEAEQQVVAGMNYRLKLKIKVDGVEKLAEAVVWWQAWRKPDPYELTSWKWSDQ
jgi:hypothetical protein